MRTNEAAETRSLTSPRGSASASQTGPQDLVPWRPPATTSSLELRCEQSRSTIARSTTEVDAARAAKTLIGSYAFLKVHDPDVFNASIAAVLSQYPLGLVQECVDPRRGAARKIKFLSVNELVDWLDGRLEFHQALARHVPRVALPAPVPKVHPPEHRATMVERFRALVASLTAGRQDPIDKLRRAHRARVEAQHAADKANALDELQRESGRAGA